MMNTFGHSVVPAWRIFAGLGLFSLLFGILVIAIVLKGYALWIASKRDEKWWFIALLIINTFGILEVIYLVVVADKWPKDLKVLGAHEHKDAEHKEAEHKDIEHKNEHTDGSKKN